MGKVRAASRNGRCALAKYFILSDVIRWAKWGRTHRPPFSAVNWAGLAVMAAIRKLRLLFMGFYRYRRFRRSYHIGAAQHVAARQRLSSAFGGIDNDIERIFLNLPSHELEAIFVKYGRTFGGPAESYARTTYRKWRSRSVKMSGIVAERLLNLVPPALDPVVRFDLVKKLRTAHYKKQSHYLIASPQDWREKLMPLIDRVISEGSAFELPDEIVKRVNWLADGDAIAAQKLLAAVDQEEASIRLSYLDAEFRRIEALVSAIERRPSIVHRITLPQGEITVTVRVPKRSFWSMLFDS